MNMWPGTLVDVFLFVFTGVQILFAFASLIRFRMLHFKCEEVFFMHLMSIVATLLIVLFAMWLNLAEPLVVLPSLRWKLFVYSLPSLFLIYWYSQYLSPGYRILMYSKQNILFWKVFTYPSPEEVPDVVGPDYSKVGFKVEIKFDSFLLKEK